MTNATETSTIEPETIVYRDPRQLVVHPANWRSDVGDIGSLTQSIAHVGVLQPIILVPTEDGDEAIIAGQRRKLAAIAAGCFSVPCIVRADLAGIQAGIGALGENLWRKDLRPIEEARAYQQLAGFGLSPTEIAKRTGSKRNRVKESLTLTSSEIAVAAGERYDFLSFEHLLGLAEFDDPESVKELVLTAKQDPGYFAHRLSELRQDRIFKEKLAAMTAQLTEAGIPIVEEPHWNEVSEMTPLSRLLNDKGKAITEKAHAHCEGHVASIHSYDPERVTYWCSDPKRYGHQDRFPKVYRGPSSTERGDDGKLTEEARSERRRIIANNKAMDAANPVRREFIVTMLARKPAPKGALRFVTSDLASHPNDMSGDDGLLAAFLGTEPGSRDYRRTVGPRAVVLASDARLLHLLVAHTATAIETIWTKEAWRRTDQRKASWLSFLASQGYRLAEVEQLVVDEAAAKVATNTEGAIDGAAMSHDDDNAVSELALDADAIDVDDDVESEGESV